MVQYNPNTHNNYKTQNPCYYNVLKPTYRDALHPNQIKKINNGRLAVKVIVSSGSMSAVEDSFKYIDKKGKILFFAVPSSNIILPSTDLCRNEISLFFSYGAATDDR